MKSSICGSWSLKSFTILPKDGGSRPWGKNCTGILIYSPDGQMSVSINKDVQDTGNKDKDLFDSVLFYAGSYSIDGEIIRHKVSNATNPSRIGKEMIRYSKLGVNELTLSSPEEAFGKAVLVWVKLA